jgi:hypothetical protein
MNEQEEKLLKLQADFDEMVESVRSGATPGVVLMTFGQGGKTILSGDPAVLVLALETAKLGLVQYTMQQAAAQHQQPAIFSMPTAGNA